MPCPSPHRAQINPPCSFREVCRPFRNFLTPIHSTVSHHPIQISVYRGRLVTFAVCIFISTLTVYVIKPSSSVSFGLTEVHSSSAPWVEAYLCLSLAFDCLAFLAIMHITLKATRSYHFARTIQVIQRDGIMYGLLHSVPFQANAAILEFQILLSFGFL